MDESKSEKVFLTATANNLPFFQALASKTRLQILTLLQNQELSISELSEALGLSSPITTRHVKALEQAGFIESYSEPGVHGLRKLCRLKISHLEVILNSNNEKVEEEFTQIDIPICSYSSFDVEAPCGMAFNDKLFGRIDDPRYFSAPNRYGLSLLWFTSGYLEYPIPTYDIDLPHLRQIEISLELCSEYPGYNNSFESDIRFYFNGHLLGSWTSPGDFGGRKGKYTPEWWNLGTEYGLLKTIRINDEGVFLDGIRLSDKPLKDFIKDRDRNFTFRIECPKNTTHPGGLNLFGRNFGDYDQSINVLCLYNHHEK